MQINYTNSIQFMLLLLLLLLLQRLNFVGPILNIRKSAREIYYEDCVLQFHKCAQDLRASFFMQLFLKSIGTCNKAVQAWNQNHLHFLEIYFILLKLLHKFNSDTFWCKVGTFWSYFKFEKISHRNLCFTDVLNICIFDAIVSKIVEQLI